MPVDMGSRGRHGERGGQVFEPARALRPEPVSLDAPPRAVSTTSFPMEPVRVPVKPPEPDPAPVQDSPLDRAFALYFASVKGKFPPEVELVLYEAFAAGYSAAGKAPIPELTGTKVSRTIVAALKVFRDQFLLAAEPEEVRTGEWCSLLEVNALIDEWEGKES